MTRLRYLTLADVKVYQHDSGHFVVTKNVTLYDLLVQNKSSVW